MLGWGDGVLGWGDGVLGWGDGGVLGWGDGGVGVMVVCWDGVMGRCMVGYGVMGLWQYLDKRKQHNLKLDRAFSITSE